MTNRCPECEMHLYPRPKKEVTHERFDSSKLIQYEFQDTNVKHASSMENMFDTSFIAIGLPPGWSDSTIQNFYKHLIMKSVKHLYMNNKNKSNHNNNISIPTTIKSTKNIHVKILHHTNDVKLISISIFTKKSVQPQQLGNVKNQKFINNVIDMFFHLQIDKGSIEFLEKVQSFVIQVHSCPFCELFNLTKELSWSSNHINNNNGSSPTVNSAGDKIHYRAFEALYSLQHFDLPPNAMKKKEMAKAIMFTEKKINDFTNDLNAVLKIRAGSRPSIFDINQSQPTTNSSLYLNRKQFADLYVSLHFHLGGPRCDVTNVQQFFSSSTPCKYTPPPILKNRDNNTTSSRNRLANSVLQPSTEDKRMWQAASVQAIRLKNNSFFNTCPVQFLNSLHRKMKPFMMFFKQSIMLSEKRQQFATISDSEIYETISMIPKLQHLRTYIILMLKHFIQIKQLEDGVFTELQFVAFFLACSYSTKYENLEVVSDGFHLGNLRLKATKINKIEDPKVFLAGECRMFMYWLSLGFNTSTQNISTTSFLYELFKQWTLVHDIGLICKHSYRVFFPPQYFMNTRMQSHNYVRVSGLEQANAKREEKYSNNTMYRLKRILYYSINFFLMFMQGLLLSDYFISNVDSMLFKGDMTPMKVFADEYISFCFEVDIIRGCNLAMFVTIFSILRAIEIVHSRFLVKPGDVDQHRLYRALKYSRLEFLLYGSGESKLVKVDYALNEYILDKKLNRQLKESQSTNYYKEYATLIAFRKTASVSTLMLFFLRISMFTTLFFLTGFSVDWWRFRTKQTCNQAWTWAYSISIFIAYFMMGSIALNIYIETCSIKLGIIRFTAMTDPFQALKKTRSGGNLRENRKFIRFPGYVDLSNLRNVIAWNKMRSFLLLNTNQRFKSIQRRALFLFFIILCSGILRIWRFDLEQNGELVTTDVVEKEDFILTLIAAFLSIPTFFFILECANINDLLESHDTLIARNIYRCENIYRDSKKHYSQMNKKSINKELSHRKRIDGKYLINENSTGNKSNVYNKTSSSEMSLMVENIKLLKASLELLSYRRDHVKLFGVAVTRNLLIGALGVFVSIMPNVIKSLTNVN